MATIVTRNGKGSKLTVAEMDSNFINLNAKKAELGIDNKVNPAQLTDVYFKGLKGDGKTPETAYTFPAANAETYLRTLPGYSSTGSLMLYVNDGTFGWGPIPTGSVGGKLDAPVIMIDHIGLDAIRLSWDAGLDAVTCMIQRDTTMLFTTPVTIYNGVVSVLNYMNVGLKSNTPYYFRCRFSAPGFQSSDFTIRNATTLAVGNTIPIKPVVAFNVTSRVLTVTHELGVSEVIMSVNGLPFIPYTPITVDDNAHVAAYWRFKVKTAIGRDESDVENSPFIDAVSSTGELGRAITAADKAYDNNTQLINGNTIKLIDTADGGSFPLIWNIPLGESGFVTMQRKAPSLTGEIRSGVLTLGIGIDPHYGSGDPKCLIATYYESDGKVFYRIKNAGGYSQTAIGALALNGYVRIRATNTTIFLELSNNNGTSWTFVASTPRASADAVPLDGTLRTKPSFIGGPEMQQLINLRVFNG
jgi:hypothetical protein